MFPIDPLFLFYIKGFVVLTCICYWLRLILRLFVRSQLQHDSWYSEL